MQHAEAFFAKCYILANIKLFWSQPRLCKWKIKSHYDDWNYTALKCLKIIAVKIFRENEFVKNEFVKNSLIKNKFFHSYFTEF